MNQKGFASIVLISIVVALVGAGAYFVSARQIRLTTPTPSLTPTPLTTPTPTPKPNPTLTPTPLTTPTPTPKPNPTLTPTPAQSPQSGNILSVVDLTDDKEVYLNKQVRVHGKVRVNVFYGEFPCKEGDPICDTSMGARLEFWQEKVVLGAENFVLLFKDGAPYTCEKIAPATYKCGPYTSGNDQLVTINGVWQKDREAIGWAGSSGGGQPTPIKWQDRYFLSIE